MLQLTSLLTKLVELFVLGWPGSACPISGAGRLIQRLEIRRSSVRHHYGHHATTTGTTYQRDSQFAPIASLNDAEVASPLVTSIARIPLLGCRKRRPARPWVPCSHRVPCVFPHGLGCTGSAWSSPARGGEVEGEGEADRKEESARPKGGGGAKAVDDEAES